MSIQARIESIVPQLSPSLRRVAARIQEDPRSVITQTISELAASSGSSVASVVRFCRAIGLAGYSELRVALATELGKESAQFSDLPGYGAEIAESDSLVELAGKISSLEVMAIQQTIENLHFDSLAKIARAVDSAGRILLFGISASQLVALDLSQKLLRIGRHAYAPNDPHEAWALSALNIDDTVAGAFSHRGETEETIRFLEIAREAGATTFAVTSSPDSPLAHVAEHTLITSVRETPFRAAAMVSRIAQLAIVDCLFAAVAQQRFGEIVTALRQTHEATLPQAFEKPARKF